MTIYFLSEIFSRKIETGQISATAGAINLLDVFGINAECLISRHRSCDWGDIDSIDWQANDEAADNDGRILSSYVLGRSEQIWIITEGNRSTTTLLLPEEH